MICKELKMTISEQFKSLNLNLKKMRKLCTNEVGVVKMKKTGKKPKCSMMSQFTLRVLASLPYT